MSLILDVCPTQFSLCFLCMVVSVEVEQIVELSVNSSKAVQIYYILSSQTEKMMAVTKLSD